MKSFLSIVVVILLSSFQAVVVDARIGSFPDDNADAYTDVDGDAGVPRILPKLANTITIESQQEQPSLQQQQEGQQRREPQSVRSLLLEELANNRNAILSDLLLVGVIKDSTAFQSQSKDSHNRNRRLYKEWARNEKGGFLWWTWIIIGLSIVFLCFCLCFCAGAFSAHRSLMAASPHGVPQKNASK